MRSVTGEPLASVRGQFAWAVFDFARSPYLSLVYIFVFPPYFANAIVGDPIRGQEQWSLANTIVGVCVAAFAPLLGAISDRTGPRKPWLIAIVAIMAACCSALWYALPGARGGLSISAILTLIVILASCFQFSEVFYNAMLPSIASPQRVGGLSGLGIAVGNFGTLVALTVMLFGIALPASGVTLGGLLPHTPWFGLDPAQQEHNRIAGPIAGAWLVLFSLPLMLWTPDRAATKIPAGRAVHEGLSQLVLTIRRARQISNVGLYLLARMLYTDGKVAILAYTGIYAAGVFQWDLVAVILFAVMLTPFSICGGLLGGWLDNRLGSKRAIQISIILTCIFIVAAVSISRDQLFFLPYDTAAVAPLWLLPYFRTLPELMYIAATMVLAASVTAAFCTSRTMMARIAPLSMMNQFFGLYALSGTATGFLGHAAVALFTSIFASQRAGFASTILLLCSGLIVMHWVKEERAAEISCPDP